MRVRQVIEQTLDEAFEAGTMRNDEGAPVTINMPVILLIQTALEILLDVRDVLMLQLQASGQVRAQTKAGIEIPGQGFHR